MKQRNVIDAALAGRVERIAERAAVLEAALQFYADEATWLTEHDTAPAWWDRGTRARRALGIKEKSA